jgi:hypothetical protein
MATSLPDASSKPLRIGVLYEEVQLTDLAGLDILGNMSSRIVSMVSNLIPAMEQLKPYARDMEFLYISSSTELAWATPDMYIRPTHTYDSAPRDLDIILLGGPDPQKVSEASLIFLRDVYGRYVACKEWDLRRQEGYYKPVVVGRSEACFSKRGVAG